MKRLLLNLMAVLFFSTGLFAQNNIKLTIHHKLGDEDFAMQMAAKNNIDNDFKVTRLQYYISEITIVHDGGNETIFDKMWVLVNADESTLVDFGNNNINTVEAIKLQIGVDQGHNHLDPAIYPSTHPLAPSFPSMHWGWAAGYRFVAFEGVGGPNFNQQFQLHGLGDNNYFTTEIMLNEVADNNEIMINLDADYARALEDINVTSGLIVHGDFGAAQKCLENFNDYVFTASPASTATIDFSEVSKFEVFPNPTIGNTTIALEASGNLAYSVTVTDLLGKEIRFIDHVNGSAKVDLSIRDSGLYFVQLIKNGHPVITKKLIVQ